MNNEFNTALSNLLSIITFDDLQKKAEFIYQANPEMRYQNWEELSLPLKDIEKRFIELTQQRILIAQEMGFDNYIDMMLHKYKTPKDTYTQFISNIEKVIDYCNDNLPQIELPKWFYTEFNNPCFICQLPNFPLPTDDNVYSLVSSKNPELDIVKDNIKITEDNSSSMQYNRESKTYSISLNKYENRRHRSLALLHELSHVICFEHDLQKNLDPHSKGTYILEKDAMNIFHNTLKATHPEIFKANLAEVLITVWRVLFEIELYTLPEQDLSELYAKTFNKCFKKGIQVKNPSFIFEERLLTLPLSFLPHAIAHGEVLSNIENSN